LSVARVATGLFTIVEPEIGMNPRSPDSGSPLSKDEIEVALPDHGYNMQPVVGLGGSAGAIPALVTFLQSAPSSAGLSYVVILHLSPEHESTLAELLQQHTAMPVIQVRETVSVEKDTVYVIPPRHALRMNDGHLQLEDMPHNTPGRVAVDLFFRTLADTHGAHATAIVLSGLDGDGAIGIKRIKERGGLTIAQDPDEAQHQGMPRAAIATGMIDWVLPVAEMPERVARYMELERSLQLPPETQAPPTPQSSAEESDLREVLSFLRTRTGRDFSNYKRATILRRIGRRMLVNGVQDLPDYLTSLRTRPGEAGALLQDLLISVTNFFRDADCFAALERQIPQLFADKGGNGVVRVWVAACATGEEAYSVAMLLAEHARTLEAPPAIQIFATDLDEDAIRIAREGVYPATIAADVNDDRLRRFFTKEHRGYRVRRELREQVLFAAHDMLKDSPFSRLDMISCRNLLIYLNREAQRRVFETAHFALQPGGRLFLGASETIEDNSPLFFILDKKHRIYAPRPVPRVSLPVPTGQSSIARALEAQGVAKTGPVVPGPSFAFGQAVEARNASAITVSEGRSVSWGELHFKMLELIAPPSIVIDGEHEIMHLSPNAGRFLQFGGGEPSRNLLHAIHPGLRIELRAAIYQVAQNQSRVEVAPLPIDIAGQAVVVRLAVMPMSDIAPGLMLVTVEALREDETPQPFRAQVAPGDVDPLSHLLDRELERLKSHLRDTVEQYEASTEELKASNEELQAMNEELRSATEELETSREELQSINEELTTVNHELKSKVDELGHANSDMQNLMDATAIATVFLDRDLRVTRYTPSAVALFNLIPTDVGRPPSHLSNQLNYPELDADARRVLQGLIPIEREVDDAQQHWYLVRMLPYRTSEDRIAGIVLTLVDVSERKRSQEALRLSEERFGAIANKAAVGVLQGALDGAITFANRFICDLLGYKEQELVGAHMLDLVHPDDRAQSEVLLARLPISGSFQIEKRLLCRDGNAIWVHNSVSHLPSPAAVGGAALVVCTDVSERKRAEDALRDSEERLRLIVDNATEYAIFSTDRERRVTSWNAGAERLLGWAESEIVGQLCDVIFTEDERAREVPRREAETALAEGRASDERIHQRKNGEQFWASGALMPMLDAAGEAVGFVKILRDQTAERLSRDELAANRAELMVALAENERARGQLEAADLAKDRFLAVLSHELRNPLASISGASEALSNERKLPPASRKRAESILRHQVDAMRTLLDDLLDISRLRFGRIALKKRRSLLSTVVDDALETARPMIEKRGHVLAVSLPKEPVSLFVDPMRMGQVLSNLLVNAAKYTEEGGHIELRARIEGSQCVIDVVDDGKGLDESALQSMFEMFWRSGELDAAGTSSMGIGLALVRTVVGLHDGTVSAKSDGPGHGSTFTVTLPVATAEETATEAQASATSPKAGPQAPKKTRKIVIADDVEDVAWSLCAVLELQGHEVRAVSNGGDVLKAVEEMQPDVAVVDIAMPAMSGYEVAERLRSTAQGRRMLLVAATGWGSEADRQTSASAGFDLHLVKPISIEDLSAAIEDWKPPEE
jgi:two-component system CheB/CheR fusion protein